MHALMQVLGWRMLLDSDLASIVPPSTISRSEDLQYYYYNRSGRYHYYLSSA